MKRYLLLSIFFLAMGTTLFGQWNVYTADSLPRASTPAFDGSCNEPDSMFSEMIIADPTIMGNNLLDYYSPGADSKQAYKVVPDPWTGFTTIIRMKAHPDSDTLDRLFDFEIRNGDKGLREKVYFNSDDNTIELDNADTLVSFDVQGWHVYRITMMDSLVSVYVDEDTLPILSGVTTNSTSSYELKIADCSSASQAALVDWLIWTGDSAFAPGAGPAIPDSLSTDFDMGWATYTADSLPRQSLPAFDGSCNSPGLNFSETIIADTSIEGNNLLAYYSPDGDGDAKQAYKIVPDPWTGFTTIIRMKAHPDADTLDRLFDFEIRNGDAGFREKVYFNYDNGIELDNADTVASFDVQGWHVYRITMQNDSVTVFVDEEPTPVLTGITTNSTSNYELKIADCSSATEAAIVDWIIWTGDGAFAPGSGPAIPDSMSVASDTSSTTTSIFDFDAAKFDLKAFPNPFTNETNLSFQLEKSATVDITVYDLMGRKVQTVLNNTLHPGDHRIEHSTEHLKPGVYLYIFRIDGIAITRRMIKERE